ncbi:MAG: type II secretion system protein GspC [Kofleriaceae bacterium]
MQDLIKRYFWVLGAVVVMVCAVFAAKATSHVVEAKYLNDAAVAPKLAIVAPSPMTQTKATRSKDGTPFALRDMFCSDCTPPVETESSIDPSSVITTSLPLQLVATSVSVDDAESSATIINTETQKQGSYSLGDVIPGANPGILKEIHYKYVEFENAGHHERLGLNGSPPPVVARSEPTPSVGSADDMQASIDNGIKKIDENHYEIDKSLVDKVLANPMGVAKGARVVPAVKDGKPDGFKLYAIRPSSVYSKLGLQNGDTLQSINGFDLTSADKALEVYTKLREATSLQVTVTRRGKQEQISYSIR